MPRRFELSVMVDDMDSANMHGWTSLRDVEAFIRKCARHGVKTIFWRLSQIGGFGYPTRFDRIQTCDPDTPYAKLIHSADVPAALPAIARPLGVRVFGWFTMFDEGWFPRFRSLIPNVKTYYKSFPMNSRFYRSLDYLSYRKTFDTEKDFRDYLPGSPGPAYRDVLPAVGMGKAIPSNDPWACYSYFARRHPECLVRTREGLRVGRCLSYAFPAVRAYRRHMVEEVLSCGLDGVLLDFTRWPADNDVLTLDEDGVARCGYEAPLVEGFRRRFRRNPARISNADPDWLQYRADHGPTRFLRDLRARLRRRFPKSKLAAMVHLERPLEEAFVDPATWMRDRLVDILLPYINPDRWRAVNDPNVRDHRLTDYLSMGFHWADLARKRVKIVNCIKPTLYNPESFYWQQESISPRELYIGIQDLKRAGSDGLAFYEEVTLTPTHWQALRMMAQGKGLKEICALQTRRKRIFQRAVSASVKPVPGRPRRFRVEVRVDPSSGFRPDVIRAFLAKPGPGAFPLAVPPVDQKERFSATIPLDPRWLKAGRRILKIVCWESEIGVQTSLRLPSLVANSLR
ncbi:MAG: hypothetical protein V2A58_01225 [Planctomycetota bacterium]